MRAIGLSFLLCTVMYSSSEVPVPWSSHPRLLIICVASRCRYFIANHRPPGPATAACIAVRGSEPGSQPGSHVRFRARAPCRGGAHYNMVRTCQPHDTAGDQPACHAAHARSGRRVFAHQWSSAGGGVQVGGKVKKECIGCGQSAATARAGANPYRAIRGLSSIILSIPAAGGG